MNVKHGLTPELLEIELRKEVAGNASGERQITGGGVSLSIHFYHLCDQAKETFLFEDNFEIATLLSTKEDRESAYENYKSSRVRYMDEPDLCASRWGALQRDLDPRYLKHVAAAVKGRVIDRLVKEMEDSSMVLTDDEKRIQDFMEGLLALSKETGVTARVAEYLDWDEGGFYANGDRIGFTITWTGECYKWSAS